MRMRMGRQASRPTLMWSNDDGAEMRSDGEEADVVGICQLLQTLHASVKPFELVKTRAQWSSRHAEQMTIQQRVQHWQRAHEHRLTAHVGRVQ